MNMNMDMNMGLRYMRLAVFYAKAFKESVSEENKAYYDMKACKYAGKAQEYRRKNSSNCDYEKFGKLVKTFNSCFPEQISLVTEE